MLTIDYDLKARVLHSSWSTKIVINIKFEIDCSLELSMIYSTVNLERSDSSEKIIIMKNDFINNHMQD